MPEVTIELTITRCIHCPFFVDAFGHGDDWCRHKEFKGRFISNSSCIDDDCPFIKKQISKY